MPNQENQSQSNERFIYLKDLHQWVPVSKTDFNNYYRDINAYRRRQQEHGRCVCPASRRYLCDMDCWTCRFHKAGDELSLDYTITDEDGNEKSWLDDLADDAPSAQSILEERDLLDSLIRKLEGLVSSYLNLLLPENWGEMDIYARQEYVRDPDSPTQPKGSVTRSNVSNLEIWCECFGKHKEDIKPSDSYVIAAIMLRIEGWQKTDERETQPIYGRQRLYKRV